MPLGLLLRLTGGIPVSAVVSVLVELSPGEVPGVNQLGQCSLDGFGAYLHPLFPLQLLPDLLGFEAGVGDAVA